MDVHLHMKQNPNAMLFQRPIKGMLTRLKLGQERHGHRQAGDFVELDRFETRVAQRRSQRIVADAGAQLQIVETANAPA